MAVDYKELAAFFHYSAKVNALWSLDMFSTRRLSDDRYRKMGDQYQLEYHCELAGTTPVYDAKPPQQLGNNIVGHNFILRPKRSCFVE